MAGDDERLFRLAHEAVAVTATYVWARGWTLRIGARRQGESWDTSWHEDYELLTTEELLQVLEAELSAQLLR